MTLPLLEMPPILTKMLDQLLGSSCDDPLPTPKKSCLKKHYPATPEPECNLTDALLHTNTQTWAHQFLLQK